MIGFVNPYCSGGKGLRKWQKISNYFGNGLSWYTANGGDWVDPVIKNSLLKKEMNFICAGGDGTINFILNRLLNLVPQEELKNIKLGAIGIGSSNDFHKPFNECKMVNGIPLKINFDNAKPRDIGCISFEENGIIRHKYFLINASIGITAEANHFFNNPDFILQKLKRINTNISIIYAAVKTILRYKNFNVKIESGSVEIQTKLTNMGIVKNPNFSGNLKYNSIRRYDNGKFNVHLCFDMKKSGIINLFRNLLKGNFHKVAKKRCWETEILKISSEQNFFVEYDGEVIETNSAAFSILQGLIKVCTC